MDRRHEASRKGGRLLDQVCTLRKVCVVILLNSN